MRAEIGAPRSLGLQAKDRDPIAWSREATPGDVAAPLCFCPRWMGGQVE